MYRQYDLVSGQWRFTCWLNSTRLRVGTTLTLKDDPIPERTWRVVSAWSQVFEQPPHQRWTVGGLQ